MKRKMLTKEEFRRIHYEFNEYKELLPDEVLTVLEKCFDFSKPIFEIEFPMRDELRIALAQLVCDEFSWLPNDCGHWWRRWVDEIADNVAMQLAGSMTYLVGRIDDIQELTKMYPDFDGILRMYTQPHTARLREVSDWSGEDFWKKMTEEQQKEWVEDIRHENELDYEQEQQQCDQYNAMKAAFVQKLQPIVLKHLDTATDRFDTEVWQHYGIKMGFTFYNYEESCSDIEYMFDKDPLTEDPELNFYEYKKLFNEKYFPSIYQAAKS